MILTGERIYEEVKNKRIVIEPFNEKNIEPNSYGFHLGNEILVYQNTVIDAKKQLKYKKHLIDEDGFVLEAKKFYLCSTMEKMGSDFYAKTLHARCSTAIMGMWIQFSAPLGHIGAIINWTLEITVAHDIRIYPHMLIGKIAFWKPEGLINRYDGKYVDSCKVVPSRIINDF